MNSRDRLSRRQFLALTGTVTAGALLAACAAPAPAAAPASSGGAEVAAAPETTTLVAWFTDRRTINVMTEEEAIPDFQAANPNITVEMQFVPESELQQKLLTAKAAGNAPDLSSIDETFLDTLTKQEVLLPIPEEVIDVKAEMGELTAELYKISVNNAPPAYYGLPNGVFSAALFYNAGLLDELGYKPEDIPTRWDDFMVWASDVTEWEGDTLKRSGFAIFGNEGSLAPDVRYHMGGPLNGNQFATKDEVRLGDELGVNSWKFAMDVYDVHKTDSKAEGLNSRERFGFGNAVTLYQWTWFNGVMDTTYTDIDWGLKNPPTMDGNPIYGRRGPDVGFTVTSQNTNNLAAAWTFWRYLVSPAYLAKYCKLRGVQPSLKTMWDDPNFSADAGPHWGAVAVNNRPENTVDEGFSPRELGDIIGRSLPSIRDEGDDITSVLQANELAANEFLASNPQWSMISAADYEANPQWLTSIG
jgi:ABC-type glycerol-3-phosphate transport system substrate-binding protein